MILQSCESFTPEFATDILRKKAMLREGSVADVTCKDDTFNVGFVSNVARATLKYSDDAKGNLPFSLFLKMSKPHLHPELLNSGRHEVEFYREMDNQSHSIPIPLIYDAQVDDGNNSHIVMQDLSASHFQKRLPVPPSIRHCEMIVEALASLHARFWNSPLLGTKLGTSMTAEQAEKSNNRLHESFPHFDDYLGDALLPAQRQMYEKILASSFLDRLGQRLIEQRQVTLIHGDVHTGNVMLPHDDQSDSVILIDWHLYAINLAAFDLAFMIALHWSRGRRELLERKLVRRYYDALVEQGVENYTWDDCWNDYRMEVIIMMLIPIGQHRRGSPAGVVWFGLQDSFAAVEDLGCEELL